MDLLEAIEDLIVNVKDDRNQQKIEALVLAANQEAINYMKEENNLQLSLNLLKRVEVLLSQEYEREKSEGIYKLIGLTLNNLGCYYKKTNKLKVALKYLNKALEVEKETFNDRINLASTHLNMCAIISSLQQYSYTMCYVTKVSRHNEAIKHAKVALELLESEKKIYLESADLDKEKADNKGSDSKYKSIIMTMVMAYFNYGTELEFINDFNGSLQALKKGHELAVTGLGSDKTLTVNIKKAITKVTKKKKTADERQQRKEEYFTKQTEQNITGRSESEDKQESVRTEKSTRALSVHYMPIRPLNLQKSPKKLTQRSLDIAHSVKNIYASQSENIILPAIKEKIKQEDNTTTQRKRKASNDEKKVNKRTHKSPSSVNLPSVTKTLTSEAEVVESSASLKKFVPLRKKGELSTTPRDSPKGIKGIEFEGSNSKIYNKLKEHLIQTEADKTDKSASILTLKKSPTRSNTLSFNKSTIVSIKEDPYEGIPESIRAEARLITESHFLKINNSRPPEEGLVNADAKRRVLKHKYFISKADLSPVSIKKDLFNKGDDVFQRGPITSVQKRALGSKKRDSKQNVPNEAETSIQGRIKTKNHTEYGD